MESVRRQKASLQSPIKQPIKLARKSPAKKQARKISSHASNSVKARKKSKKVKKSQSTLTPLFRRLTITPKPPTSRRPSTSFSRNFHSGTNRGLCTLTPSTIEDIAGLLREEKFKNIIVMAGAGISCPSGIPDFRFVLFNI